MPTVFANRTSLPDRFGDERHLAMEEGLQRIGYKLVRTSGPPEDERDVRVTWTVHRGFKGGVARALEAAGGRVILYEEAHLKGLVRGEKLFTVCLHDHNGAGSWTVRGPERWASFGIELKPWRERGEHIIVREQRGIGSLKMRSPPNWHEDTAARLWAITGRPVRIRRHPKIVAREGLEDIPLGDDLCDCHALVTWASSDGTLALIEGVPAVALAPNFFVESACERSLTNIETPSMPDRLPAFERLAWAQWSLQEIKSGLAIDFLLNSKND